MSCGCGSEQSDSLERKTLIWLLLINAVMFIVELGLGWYAQSTGLIADSLDMLADAMVYGLSLYAVGKSLTMKANAAQLSGYLQILLGLGVIFEVVRRWWFGSEPESDLMIIVAFIALLANLSCLALIAKHRNGEVHMRASWIFSTNDVIANLGVMISGALVAVFASRYPDLIIGAIISALVVRGGLRILADAKSTKSEKQSSCGNS